MAQADYGSYGGAYADAPQADHGYQQETLSQTYAGGAGALINVLGGVVSLALIAGVCVWGYQILARDVSGVPVVSALDGPMREAPADPGGRPADHQGLAVNEVAAIGTAGAPRDRLVLAPPALSLTDDDQPQSQLASVPAQDALPNTGSVASGQTVLAAPLEDADGSPVDVNALVAELAAGASPFTPLAEGEDVPVVAEVAALDTTAATLAPDLGPGLARSLRPRARPVALNTAAVAPSAAVASVNEIAPTQIAAGTRLVQLGAFDSAEVARSEWDRLQTRFGDFMEGKARVVQRAEKGGRTFYRLRAHGFSDLADARRFCSALVAQNAACIPVLVK
ncbi:MAG: SPOR domain-containing protein [Pseudomonadota bacterium]